MTRVQRLASLLMHVAAVDLDSDYTEFRRQCTRAMDNAMNEEPRNIELSWKLFAEKAIEWIDKNTHEEEYDDLPSMFPFALGGGGGLPFAIKNSSRPIGVRRKNVLDGWSSLSMHTSWSWTSGGYVFFTA